MLDLKAIYLETLAACAPARLAALAAHHSLPRNVVAIGKCAGPMFDGIASRATVENAIVIAPHGYPGPRSTLRRKEVHFGSHPQLSDASFVAGEALLAFVDRHVDFTFLISGGGSACAEWPLDPWFSREDLVHVNARLLDAGLPIASMNVVRKHLSAIKGGRLGARARGHRVTLVHSDVGDGRVADVASGPTLADSSTINEAIAILERAGGCEPILEVMRDASFPATVHWLDGDVSLIADNGTLVAAAADIAATSGWRVSRGETQIETDVDSAVALLIDKAVDLERGSLFAAGGEVTVALRAPGGRGGRCTELAVRFAVSARERGLTGVHALFGSSDGVDGSSPAAAILMEGVGSSPPDAMLFDAIRSSDTFSAASTLGEAIMIPPTGNNLRDLVLLARP